MNSFPPTKIKNCGLKTLEHVACAIASGASYIGFVYNTASPRHVTVQEIADLSANMGDEAASVIVMVDPVDELLLKLPKPNFWQVHGVRDPARIKHIAELTGIPVITAISIFTPEDLFSIAGMEAVSAHLLFDAKTPGSGQAFDWALLQGIRLTKPWFLAGGLTPANVAEAIRITHAPMVDVSSGIEESPGVKSLEKIAAFNAAVLNASHA